MYFCRNNLNVDKIFAEFFSFFLAHDSLPIICNIYSECVGKAEFESIIRIIRGCSFFPLGIVISLVFIYS